jgi:hypothetical protein
MIKRGYAKRVAALSLTVVLALGSIAGCGSKNASVTTTPVGGQAETVSAAVADAATEAATAKTDDSHPNEARSFLTGKWVDKETANNKPVAVMYSNIQDAIPQSSISYADIVFESLVEGGITRLCAYFENKTELTKIGPVRSCRLYYLFLAKEFEATYVHYGYSDLAEEYLKMEKMHSLDGMVYCGFYRSTDRVAPHNAYTSWAGIMDSVEAKGYPTTYPEGYRSPFVFNEDDDNEIDLSTQAIAQKCSKFYPGYPYNKPWFEYNSSDGLYYRYQFGAAQVDKETGEQLAFKNIIVKYVTGDYVDGTPNYDNTGAGMGLYITNGYAVPISWWKLEEYGQTYYYGADGNEITINQGKTFICYVEEQYEGNVEIVE